MEEKEISTIEVMNETVVESVQIIDNTSQNLSTVSDVLDMEKQYAKLMYIHEAAIEQITAKLNILKGEFKFSNDRNPIASISGRVKTKESILYKMQKKGLPMTITAMTENIYDIAGVRVTCPFIEDVYYVARMLTRQMDIDIIQVKDYIREPKENGYRSLHLIVNTNVYFANTARKVPVEIQIRTIAMDFWASTEHQLRYKKNYCLSDESQQKLKHCAELMAQADLEIQEIAGGFDLEKQW